jgi:hypothetical protein
MYSHDPTYTTSPMFSVPVETPTWLFVRHHMWQSSEFGRFFYRTDGSYGRFHQLLLILVF